MYQNWGLTPLVHHPSPRLALCSRQASSIMTISMCLRQDMAGQPLSVAWHLNLVLCIGSTMGTGLLSCGHPPGHQTSFSQTQGTELKKCHALFTFPSNTTAKSHSSGAPGNALLPRDEQSYQRLNLSTITQVPFSIGLAPKTLQPQPVHFAFFLSFFKATAPSGLTVISHLFARQH